ncbi:MAG: NADH-quinone oxidoreductase subunit J [Thermoguttaceae bacterium]|nr:NADH-quinone oxidoreductase subunit J [Thermoguttaceae bacterium]MDW8079048.1 NADH-quinone oxidoreductase subunit J [Thermoguttaceae bacterium]
MMSEIVNLWLFYFFAGVACGGAIGVAVGRDLVRSAFCLMLSLGGVAGLFFQLGASLLGAVQLLVYVGGTLVLLVFGIMLTSSQAAGQLQVKAAEVVLAAAASLGLLGILLWSGSHALELSREDPRPRHRLAVPETDSSMTETLAGALVGIRIPIDFRRAAPAGLTDYLLAFEVVSVHLLVVLVGAAYLARARWPRFPQFGRVQNLPPLTEASGPAGRDKND